MRTPSLVLLALLLPTIQATDCSFQNFCPNGVTRPLTIVEGAGDGINCQSIGVGISLGMVPEEQCGQLLYAEMFCCPKEDEEPVVCSLCGNSDDTIGMSHMDRIVDGESCLEIEQKMQLNPREKSCNAWKDVYQSMKSVDTQAYCGCETATPPNQCQLCGDNVSNEEVAMMVDPLAMVPTDGYSNMTCLELLHYASHVTNMDACASMGTAEIQAACCAGSGANNNYSRILWGVILAMGLALVGI